MKGGTRLDELTPLEPEYQELPPEQPMLPPNYYGTGIQPQPKKSKMPLLFALFAILLTANFVTMTVSLFLDHEHTETRPPESNHLLPIDIFPEDSEKRHDQLYIDRHNSTMLKDIYNHYAPGVVSITAHTDRGILLTTGVVLTEDGYILADSRTLSQPQRVRVTLHDGTTCDAAFVGMDSESEMVILKIEHDDLKPVSLDEEVGKQAEQVLHEFLENAVRPATLNLEVSEVTKPMQIYWHLPAGVIVNRISSNSNAYRAGLRPGDVLLKIGQISLSNPGDYLEALSSYAAGETVRIYLFREGKTYYADVCLDSES